MKLRIDRFPAGAGALFEGDVDEHADLRELGTALTGPIVTLDVGGIRRINSLGVRSWIGLIRQLRTQTVWLRRCPPVVIEQLGFLRDFRGHSRIESLLLPYSCERCDTRVLVELALAPLRGQKQLPPGPPCTTCGEPSVLDDFPERYLTLPELA